MMREKYKIRKYIKSRDDGTTWMIHFAWCDNDSRFSFHYFFFECFSLKRSASSAATFFNFRFSRELLSCTSTSDLYFFIRVLGLARWFINEKWAISQFRLFNQNSLLSLLRCFLNSFHGKFHSKQFHHFFNSIYNFLSIVSDYVDPGGNSIIPHRTRHWSTNETRFTWCMEHHSSMVGRNWNQ